MAVGYATLYGDMAGGFAVIKDVFKTFVYRLARYRNTLSAVIPENIITRPPSAELKPGQTDQDTLPPYEVLDAIIEAYMERDHSPREIIALGYGEADVRRVVGMLKTQRIQAPPVAGGHSRLAARLRQGLALSDNISLFGRMVMESGK